MVLNVVLQEVDSKHAVVRVRCYFSNFEPAHVTCALPAGVVKVEVRVGLQLVPVSVQLEPHRLESLQITVVDDVLRGTLLFVQRAVQVRANHLHELFVIRAWQVS